MKKILKIAGIIIGAIVFILIGTGIGSSGAEATVNGKKMDITSLDKEISKMKKDLNSIKQERNEAKAIIDKKDAAEEELADAEAKLKDIKGTLDKELAEGRKDVDAKLQGAKKELSNTQAKLKETKAKLASATGQLQKAEGAPKKLGSGQYVVGKDIPAGRYNAHALGRGSNFFVYDGASGSAKVNTILGTAGGIGTGDYTFFCQDGDIIETHEPVRLTPVK
ncbi:hypothetical protein [Neobacillus mesonae]|uniref:hypothetical protein n=1 Tax=Neobacillus mesonae TaxID=1193713 RepID=UPI00203D8D04|nr:hypothetical protein [Neobacillus mesonae]MCM3570317.1 hypothetical protein [Neobacillus mesonae]